MKYSFGISDFLEVISSLSHSVVFLYYISNHPNNIMAYWATQAATRAFENKTKIEDVSETRIGMATADNERFVRLWHEVDISI